MMGRAHTVMSTLMCRHVLEADTKTPSAAIEKCQETMWCDVPGLDISFSVMQFAFSDSYC